MDYGPNLMRDGTISTIGQGPTQWYTFQASNANDGNTGGTAYGITLGAPASYNDGRGLTLTFFRAISPTRFVQYGYNLTFNYVIQYYANDTWNTIDTIANSSGTMNLDFNLDSAISSTQWRWYIANWNNPDTNYYCFEFEVYEELPAGPANLKSYNGLLKANIKSIMGLGIGSVKSVNGLS